MKQISTADDALGVLGSFLKGKPLQQPTTSTITVKKGTEVTSCWSGSSWFASKELKTPGPWNGVVVHDDASSKNIIVYLAGFGLCTIQRQDAPNKKRKVTKATNGAAQPDLEHRKPSTILKSLKIDLFSHGGELDGAAVMELFGSIIGSSLEALCVTSGDVRSLEAAVKHFPGLKSLKHPTGGILKSLDVFSEAYRSGSRISALDLSVNTVDTEGFNKFLALLAQEDTMKRHIELLRVGTWWQHTPMTDEFVTSVLRDNSVLKTFHVETSDSSKWSGLLKHHGQALTTLPVESEPDTAYRTIIIEEAKKK